MRSLTGFRIQPVPGLVPTRTFYGALAERRFLSTQYVRHTRCRSTHPSPTSSTRSSVTPTCSRAQSSPTCTTGGHGGAPGTRDEPRVVQPGVLVQSRVRRRGRRRRLRRTAPGSCRPTARSRRSSRRRSAVDLRRWAPCPTTSPVIQPVLFAADSLDEHGGRAGPFFDRDERRLRPSARDVHDRYDRRDRAATADQARGWDCIEFWVGNARDDAGLLMSAFGFSCTGYAGAVTASGTRPATYSNRGIRLSSRRADRGLAHRRPRAHPRRRCARPGLAGRRRRSRRRAPSPTAPVPSGSPGRERRLRDLGLATVATYGETQHTFVDPAHYRSPCSSRLPHRRPAARSLRPATGWSPSTTSSATSSRAARRLGGVLPRHDGLLPAASLRRDQISTEYSALMSTVVWEATKIVMPLNEPADGRRRARSRSTSRPTTGRRAAHRPAHRRHRRLGRRPARGGACGSCAYRPLLRRGRERLAGIDLPWDDAVRARLVDRGRTGTCCRSSPRRSPTGRRCSSRSSSGAAPGFGEGNFKALFEAIERDQAKRGDL